MANPISVKIDFTTKLLLLLASTAVMGAINAPFRFHIRCPQPVAQEPTHRRNYYRQKSSASTKSGCFKSVTARRHLCM